jgi:hypothetical protein
MMVESGDGCGGCYDCGDRSQKKKLAPLGAPSKIVGSHVTYIPFICRLPECVQVSN